MKTKIAALITALLIILIGAGGIYYISRNSPEIQGITDTSEQINGEDMPENQSVRYIEEPTDTRVEDWLKFIGKELELETINISDGSFMWEVEIGDEEVLGQSLLLDTVADGTIDIVLDLFEKYNFEENETNTQELEFSTYGYQKDDIVCILKTSESEELLNLEIRCGLLDPQVLIIKKLYLDELDKDPSTIQVEIIQSTAGHMSGSVQLIEPDEDSAVQNGLESFLAAKDEEGAWVLVLSGNQTLSCELIEPYDFPIEMVPECFDEDTGEMIERTETQPTQDLETESEPELEIETDQTAS